MSFSNIRSRRYFRGKTLALRNNFWQFATTVAVRKDVFNMEIYFEFPIKQLYASSCQSLLYITIKMYRVDSCDILVKIIFF
jgi:hypothetical protein